MNGQTPPIIIIRKKGGHAAHHGGAWKVAYADFVTAMMALFIVLWLLNSSEQVKKAISAYFTDPSGVSHEVGSANAGSGETLKLTMDEMAQLKEKLDQEIKKSPELAALKDYVQMSVSGEGLRIELIENEHGIFFDSGSSHPSTVGREMIERLAQELAKLPNELMIEGHTDSKPFTGKGDYSNWELSTDRANAARRMIETGGVPANQIQQVRGYADRNLRVKENPQDPSNRRVTVIVRYQPAPPAPANPTIADAKAPTEHKAPPEHK
jgi:chemotaxis protein MotB